MFIVKNTLKVEHENAKDLLNHIGKKNALNYFQGFVKKEILEHHHKEYMIYEILVYFENKLAFYKWEGSQEHIQMHKEKAEKPKGVINVSHQTFILKQLDLYEKV